MAIWRVGGIRPRVINVDGHAAYPQAIRELKASGELSRQVPTSAQSLLKPIVDAQQRFSSQLSLEPDFALPRVATPRVAPHRLLGSILPKDHVKLLGISTVPRRGDDGVLELIQEARD